MTIVTSYLDLAKQCLVESYTKRDSIAVQNLNIEAALLVHVALAALSKDESTGRGITSAKPYDGTGNPLAQKISAFIQQKLCNCVLVDPYAWGFSVLPKSSDTASRLTLEEKLSWVTYLFKAGTNVLLSEEELNARFKNCFEHIEPYYIAEACSDLFDMYRNKDFRAGYYLVWLIKYVTQGEFAIPAQEAFTESTVNQVLSTIFANKIPLTFPFKLAEILFCPWGRWNSWAPRKNEGSIWPFYMKFLDQALYPAFLNFTEECLKVTPHDAWPAKWQILMNYLRLVDYPRRVALAQSLLTSEDSQTSRMGNGLLQALQAASFREQIPYFDTLKKLLPHSYKWNIEIIFGRPFIELRQSPEIYKNDPPFTSRLCFRDKKQVFFEENLIIGVYDSSHNAPPHLLAYDMNTEKMVWGIALAPSMQTNRSLISSYPVCRDGSSDAERNYNVARWGNYLTLQFNGSNIVTLIDAKTGTITSTIDLQYNRLESLGEFHLTSDGLYCYQRILAGEKRIIAGGTICNGKWTECFQHEDSNGLFIPVFQHLGLLNKETNRLHLFGQKGERVTIENCLSAYAQNNKLYFIQTDPAQENICFLHRATLTSDKEVIFEEQPCIPLNTDEASILKICSNGLTVLFDHSRNSPIFFTPTDTVVYHPFKTSEYPNYIVNPETGDMWCTSFCRNTENLLDIQGTNSLYKITPGEAHIAGELKSMIEITPIHVDSKGRFYFMTPFG